MAVLRHHIANGSLDINYRGQVRRGMFDFCPAISLKFPVLDFGLWSKSGPLLMYFFTTQMSNASIPGVMMP